MSLSGKPQPTTTIMNAPLTWEKTIKNTFWALLRMTHWPDHSVIVSFIKDYVYTLQMYISLYSN
jgi:hypothetical protein